VPSLHFVSLAPTFCLRATACHVPPGYGHYPLLPIARRDASAASPLRHQPPWCHRTKSGALTKDSVSSPFGKAPAATAPAPDNPRDIPNFPTLFRVTATRGLAWPHGEAAGARRHGASVSPSYWASSRPLCASFWSTRNMVNHKGAEGLLYSYNSMLFCCALSRH